MKFFTKVALVSAMAISANAMALQSMDEEELSATTGQDGITIKVFTPGITIDKLFVHDNNGLDSAATIGVQVANPAYATALTAEAAAHTTAATAIPAAQTALNAAQTAYNAAYVAEYQNHLGSADPHADTIAALSGSAEETALTTAQTNLATAQNALTTAIDARQNTPRTVAGIQNLGGTNTAGAIIISDVSIAKQSTVPGTTPLATINIDADGGAAADSSEATLNIGVKLAATDIRVGAIGVGKSNGVAANYANATALQSLTGARRGVLANSHTIIENLDIALGATDLNIQLGHQPQGAMILLDGTVQGGLVIDSLKLTDNNGLFANAAAAAAYGGSYGAGSITLGAIKVTSAASADLIGGLKIDVDQNLGLALTIANSHNDIYVSNVQLGNTPSIGDIEIQGLNLGGTTLFVSGH